MFPGFGASSSPRHASSTASAIGFGCSRACANSDIALGLYGKSGEKVASKSVGDIDGCGSLQTRPSGHAINFKDSRPFVAIVHNIDAGKIGPDHGSRSNGKVSHDPVCNCCDWFTAALYIGHPTRGMAHHSGDNPPLWDKNAKIMKALAFGPNISL